MVKSKTTEPNVTVTIEGGVADVTVHQPGILVEVRDYDLHACDYGRDRAQDVEFWLDENNHECQRWFVGGDRYQEDPPTPERKEQP